MPTRVVCPVGSYSEGDTACLICPAATTSNAGSTSINACVNVITNFSFAVSSVLLAFFVSIVYLYFGRYHRVAHVRRERVVLYQLQQFRNISEALSNLEKTLREMRIQSRLEKDEEARGCLHGAKKLLKLLLFYLAVPVILVAAGVVTMLHETLRDLVDVLILFRGLRQYITVPYLAFLNAVLASLGPLLEVLFAPIREILRVLAFLKIDLSALQVTCPGASAPVNLFLDYLILGALIVVVGSDYQLFRSTVLRALQERVSALIFSKEYKKHCMPEKVGKPSFMRRMASAVGLGWCWPSSCCGNSDELALVVATTEKAPPMKWSALHYWYFLFCTLLASAASELLDFQLLLRFFLSQVHLDFFGTLTAASASVNDCNHIKGLERADGALAMISFLNAVFMFIPLVFEIGKFVVHGAPPVDSDGPIHRAKEDIYNNDKAKEERREKAAEAERAKYGGDGDACVSLWNFAWSDFLLWLPSVLAPDLWLALLSNAWINLLKTAVASSDNDKRLSNKSSWLDSDQKVVQVPPSDEARLALACASALCCPCFRGDWLCSRCGCGHPCSQGGVILSVLAPRYLVAESSYSFHAGGSRFEREPASCLVQPSLTLVPEDGPEGESIHPSSRQAVLQWQSKFRKEEDARWKNSSRGHSLPTFHELLMLYNREWEQLCKVPNSAPVLAAPNLFTMGLAGHIFLQSGRAIWGQIVYNFLVFFASCFGVWTRHTQEYYGVKECVEVMSVANVSTAGQTKGEKGNKGGEKVDREIVEEWQEYSEAWAALIGPRSILLLLVPQLTPLMTFTKIMATSPLYIDDPSVPAPHMLDIYSFYRKARKEVYLRDVHTVYTKPEDAYKNKDLLEWMVYLGAMQQFFTSSRLLTAVFNWCKLAFVFGLLASSKIPELQRYVFAAQVGFYFLRGCVLGIKGVVYLGGELGLKDGDLPFTGGGWLRERIDTRCRIKMESSYDKDYKPPERPRVSHADDVEGCNPMADNHPPSGSQGFSHDQGRSRGQSQTSGHSQSHAQTHSNAHAHAHNQSHSHSLGSAKDSGVELTGRRSNAEQRSVPAASVVSYSDAAFDADRAGYSVHPKNSFDSYHEYNSSSSSSYSATRPSYNSSSSSAIRPSRTSEECMREFRDSIPSMQEAAEASSAETSRARQAWFYSKGGEEYGPNSAEDMGRFYMQYPDDFSPLTPIRLQHWRGCHSAWRVFGSLDARAYFSSVPVYSEPAPCTWLMLHQGREFGPNTADAMQAYFLGFPDVYNAATMVRAEGWRQFHAAADVFGPALEAYFVRSTYAEPHFAQTKRVPPPGPDVWPAPSTHATSVQGHRGQTALSRPSASFQSHSMPPSLSPSTASGRGGGGRGANLQVPRRRLGPGNNL